jgi:hypothetical protein
VTRQELDDRRETKLAGEQPAPLARDEHGVKLIECTCGCGATMRDDGRCECGKPRGHR